MSELALFRLPLRRESRDDASDHHSRETDQWDDQHRQLILSVMFLSERPDEHQHRKYRKPYLEKEQTTSSFNASKYQC